jgi:ribosomal protein L37E
LAPTSFIFENKVLEMNKTTKKPTCKAKSLQEFRSQFGTQEQCLKYLSVQKWRKDLSTFQCNKCGHTSFGKSRYLFGMRCSKCGYDESAMAHTMFHKTKISIVKAFEMVYRISTNKKGASSMTLTRELGISQHSTWFFRRKIQKSITESVLPQMLKGRVQVDECFIGGEEEEAKGRSFGKKQKVLIVTEIIEKICPISQKTKNVVGNQVMFHIPTFRKEDILPNIENCVSKEESILQTDGFKTYKSIKEKNGWNVEIENSNKGKSHPQIHLQIMNLKSWLRGIHHKCHPKYLQNYLSEFCYRFNRRNLLNFIPEMLLKTMAKKGKMVHDELITKKWLAV